MSTPETPSRDNDFQAMNVNAPITFRGSLTVSDAYAAFSLAQPFGNKIAMWIARAFFFAALGCMCWLAVYAYYDGEYNLARMALAGVVLVLLPICVTIGRELWHRKRANQLWKEGKLLFAPTEGEIDDDSIRSKAEIGEGTLNWSAFCGYREAETVAVLFQYYPGSYVIMARSKFESDQDWADFLQLASRKLKRI